MSDAIDDLSALRYLVAPLNTGGRRWGSWVVLLASWRAGGGAVWWTTCGRARLRWKSPRSRARGRRSGVGAQRLRVRDRPSSATISSKVTGKVVEVNVEEGMAVRQGRCSPGSMMRRRGQGSRWRMRDSKPHAARCARWMSAGRSAVDPEAPHPTVPRRASGRSRMSINAKAEVDSLVAASPRRASRSLWRSGSRSCCKPTLDNTIVRAPFSGVAVKGCPARRDGVAGVGRRRFHRTGICTIVDMRSLEIEVDVNESYINRVKSGQHVTAVLDAYPDFQIPAKVITIGAHGGPSEGHGAGAHWIRPVGPAHPAGHGREGHVPSSGGRHGCARGAGDVTRAQGCIRRPRVMRAWCSWCDPSNTVERRAVRTGGTMVIGRKCWPD